MKCLAWTVVFVLASVAAVDGQDKIIGAAWEIKFATRTKSVKPVTLVLRATPDGKVHDAGSDVVGSWKGNNEKAEMNITGFKEKGERFKGTYTLTNLAAGPIPRWSGKWSPPDGSISRVVGVRLLKD